MRADQFWLWIFSAARKEAREWKRKRERRKQKKKDSFRMRESREQEKDIHPETEQFLIKTKKYTHNIQFEMDSIQLQSTKDHCVENKKKFDKMNYLAIIESIMIE